MLMNIQATKQELIRMISEIQSETLLENLRQYLKKVEIEEKKTGIHVLSEQRYVGYKSVKQNKTKDNHVLSKKETRLLTAINKGIPEAIRDKYNDLQTRRKEGAISESEREELLNIVDRVEAIEGERLENMIALAELWNMTLGQLRERLGIKAPEPHVW